METIKHPWKGGGDNSQLPQVSKLENGRWLIKADGDTDADGSPRVGSIDPSSGQSCTSLGRPAWKGPNEYPDSEKIPFFVLPLNWTDVTGVRCGLGDMAKLSYKEKIVYAIFADEGPRSIIGEASICAIEKLGGNPWNAAKTRIVSGLPFGVTYEIIPGSKNLARTVSFESIQEYGKELFELAPKEDEQKDFSQNFEHLKNVKADKRLSIEDSHDLWTALVVQANDKLAFNKRVALGVKESYGNAQCAITTASVLEGACRAAGLIETARIFSKPNRDDDNFALTHQIEIILKRLGFVMYSKKDFVAPRGAICMMKGRYNFAGCKQHSGHVFTMYTDCGPEQKDVINDNGGFAHPYSEYTESFFLPRGIAAVARNEQPKPTTNNAAKFVALFKDNYDLVRKEVEAWFAGVYSDSAVHKACVAHQVSALKLAGLPYPTLGTMESINVDHFVRWAKSQGWKLIEEMKHLQAGDICVSGPSMTDIDHVYCFLDFIDSTNAHVLHNQVFGVATRSLAGIGCGKWRFALRM